MVIAEAYFPAVQKLMLTSRKKRRALLLMIPAWVLWIRTNGRSGASWLAQPGFPTEARCLASIKDKMDVWRQFKDAKMTDDTVIFTENNTSMSYYCLPDTQDPRR
jgi:hypothetical protein